VAKFGQVPMVLIWYKGKVNVQGHTGADRIGTSGKNTLIVLLAAIFGKRKTLFTGFFIFKK
jgi:hypothetical protein